jgi:hypothetical protein
VEARHVRVLLSFVISVLGQLAGFKLLQWRNVFGLFNLDCEGFFVAGAWGSRCSSSSAMKHSSSG